MAIPTSPQVKADDKKARKKKKIRKETLEKKPKNESSVPDKAEKKEKTSDVKEKLEKKRKKEEELEPEHKKSKENMKRKPDEVVKALGEGLSVPQKKRKIEAVQIDTGNDNNSFPIEKEEQSDVPAHLQLSSYRLTQATLDSLHRRGIGALFPIQAATFNHIYDGKDVLARAKTGTGKTLAFALPITERLLIEQNFIYNKNRRGRAPRVIVLTPTRDLAKQVSSEFESIAPDLTVLCVYGGVPYNHGLRDGIDVLVGTPGRILDHIDRGDLKFNEINFVVLDEADQMLDIGFAEAMEKVLQHVKDHKENKGKKDIDYQIMLFSATVPDWVKETVKKYLRKDYINVDLIGKMDNKTNENIRHFAIRSTWASRKDIIGDVVACYAGQGSCVIFCNTKNDANELALNDKLKQDCQVLHGDIAQSQREITMKGFREGKFKCIICTDVLARGIDIPQVDLVINCEPPKDVETYVHRSGRTGRAGRSGTAVTFFKSQDEYLVQNIQRHTKIQFQIVGPPQPVDIISVAAQGAVSGVESVNPSILQYFHATAQSLIEQKGALDALSAALAYMTGYANGVKARSLITGNEGQITLLFRFNYPIRHVSYVRNILEKSFPNLSAHDVKVMRLTKDGLGIAVDVSSEKVAFDTGEGKVIFLAGKQWQDTPSTKLEVCKELPTLLDRSSDYRKNNGGGFGKNGFRESGRDNGYGRSNGYGGLRGNGYNSGARGSRYNRAGRRN